MRGEMNGGVIRGNYLWSLMRCNLFREIACCLSSCRRKPTAHQKEYWRLKPLFEFMLRRTFYLFSDIKIHWASWIEPMQVVDLVQVWLVHSISNHVTPGIHTVCTQRSTNGGPIVVFCCRLVAWRKIGGSPPGATPLIKASALRC